MVASPIYAINAGDDLIKAQEIIASHAENIASKIDNDNYKKLFLNAYNLSIKNSVLTDSKGTFIITGGWQCYGPSADGSDNPPGTMDAMWIRDAVLQLHTYLNVYKDNSITDDQLESLDNIIQDFIKRSSNLLKSAPSAHAFNQDNSIAESDYEADSPAFLIWFIDEYLQVKRDSFKLKNIAQINSMLKVVYEFYLTKTDNDINLVSSDYRPSDDKAEKPYNIPTNMLIASAFNRISKQGFINSDDAKNYSSFSKKINNGLLTIKEKFATRLPFETDKKYNDLFMDDANLPGLLSIPYLTPEYSRDSWKEIYNLTRTAILDPEQNPYYFISGSYQGLGSPHIYNYTQRKDFARNAWPIGMITEAFTEASSTRKQNILNQLIKSAQAPMNYNALQCSSFQQYIPKFTTVGFLRESFSVDNDKMYTRGWFTWPNAYFAEYAEDQLNQLK